MFAKITAITFLVAACQAALVPLDQGHGHAVSSQSIIRHDQPTQQILQHQPILTHQSVLQHQPIIQHQPLLQHQPIIQHQPLLQQHLFQPAPVVEHQPQILTHSAPILQHSAPILQHSAPLLTQSIQHAPIVQHVAPVAHKVYSTHSAQIEEHYAPAKYEFSYSVEDPHTGDHKSQHESRDGDVVKGEYSLVQPDGSVRKVEYTADDHSGFNAIVHNSAPGVHAAPAAPAHVLSAPVLAHH